MFDWELRKACCLRHAHVNANFAPYPADRHWEYALDRFRAITGYQAWIDFGHIKDNPGRGPRCDCTCCRYRQFVSVVAKTTHKDGASSMPDGKPFTHDFGADLRKPYVIEDHTKDSSVGVFNHLIEEWQPVVLKLNVIIGERNGKFVYGVRHFYEDVEVYEPNHLGAAKEGASKGMVSAHAYFSRPVNTPVEILRAKVHAYGREPFDDPNGAHGYNLRTECSNWFKDYPQVTVDQGFVTDYEIMFLWPACAAPGCLWGGVLFLKGPIKPDPRAYCGLAFVCRIAVRLDYTGLVPKVTTTGHAIDKQGCLRTYDRRSPSLW